MYISIVNRVSTTTLLMIGFSTGLLSTKPASIDRICKNGDIIIGGLFSLHNTAPYEIDGITNQACDEHYQDTVLLVEAMIYAIQQVNSSVLKDFEIGYNIQGTCDDSLENMFYGLDIYTDLQSKITNNSHKNPLETVSICDQEPPIVALIGPASSSGSASVSSLFRLNDIPVISYDATSPELGNHVRFPSFYRTIYSDDKQAAALVDLVQGLGWNYISVVGSDDNLGRQGIYEFKRILWQKKRLCVASEAYFGDDLKLKETIKSLKLNIREEGNVTTNVTLLFMDFSHAERFLRRAYEMGLNETTWLGVDHWTANWSMTYYLPGYLPSMYTNGTVSTEIPSEVPRDFLQWLNSPGVLKTRIQQNKWLFRYFCQECWKLLKAREVPSYDSCTMEFTTSEQCFKAINISVVAEKQRRISNVISAVYAVGYALETMPKENEKHWFKYSRLIDHLNQLNVTKVPGLSPNSAGIRFDSNGNLADASFEIHNFYSNCGIEPAMDDGQVGKRYMAPDPVGLWKQNPKSSEPMLQLNVSRIVWKTGEKPASHCSRNCNPGEKVVYGPTYCCWDCEHCPEGTYSNESQSEVCYECGSHHHTDATRSQCIANQVVWISYKDALGISNVVLCSFGVICVLFASVVSFRNRHRAAFSDEPTMKTAILINCFLGYTYVVYHTFSPDVFYCSLRRVAWQTAISAHLISAFFQVRWGRAQAVRLLRWTPLPDAYAPHVGYAVCTLIGLFIYVIVVHEHPPTIDYTDLVGVTGEKEKTYADCGEGPHGPWVIGLSVIYPGCFWLVAVVLSFRAVQLHKRSKLLETVTRDAEHRLPKNEHLHTRQILYSSYVGVLIVASLTPIYVTMDDPWNRSFLLLIGAFTANSVALGLYFIPRGHAVMCSSRSALSRSDSIGEIFVITKTLAAKIVAAHKHKPGGALHRRSRHQRSRITTMEKTPRPPIRKKGRQVEWEQGAEPDPNMTVNWDAGEESGAERTHSEEATTVAYNRDNFDNRSTETRSRIVVNDDGDKNIDFENELGETHRCAVKWDIEKNENVGPEHYNSEEKIARVVEWNTHDATRAEVYSIVDKNTNSSTVCPACEEISPETDIEKSFLTGKTTDNTVEAYLPSSDLRTTSDKETEIKTNAEDRQPINFKTKFSKEKKSNSDTEQKDSIVSRL